MAQDGTQAIFQLKLYLEYLGAELEQSFVQELAWNFHYSSGGSTSTYFVSFNALRTPSTLLVIIRYHYPAGYSFLLTAEPKLIRNLFPYYQQMLNAIYFVHRWDMVKSITAHVTNSLSTETS
jgi:hypothetical protein